MKKKLLVCLMCFVGLSVIHAQIIQVEDIPHILETIHNGYQIYQQVQNEIESLKMQYESTRREIQNLQKLDPSDIHSFTDAVGMVDKNLTFLRTTEDTLRNYRMTVGDNSYDLLSIYKIPEGVVTETEDKWNAKLSDEDKARIWSYYGLDPRNYMYVQTWKKRISKAAQKIAAMSDSIQKQYEKNEADIENRQRKQQDKINDTDSTVGQLQMVNTSLVGLADKLDNLSLQTGLIGQVVGDSAQEQYIPPKIGVSDDFLKEDPAPEPIKLKGIF